MSEDRPPYLERRLLDACELASENQLRYAEARQEADRLHRQAQRAGRRFWIWMSVYGVSAVILGWQLRGFFP
jgi:hypothetical protein